MSFGEKLRTLRNERGLTQAQLGECLMLSESTISLYESDRRSPDQDKLKKIATFFNVSTDFLLGADIREIDVIDIFQNTDIKLTAVGRPLTPEQRLGVIRALDNPLALQSTKVPILGQIKMGVPILAQDNWEGKIEVPSDFQADFALEAHGDSMIGVGLLDGDYAICREASTAHSGDIVVSLQRTSAETSDATLKFYFREKGSQILRAANPVYEDIEMDEDWRIGGVLVGIIRKDAPAYRVYNSYLAARDVNGEQWDPVVEKASQLGIKPEQVNALLDMIYQTSKR